jgi:hypothetical protein
VIERLLATVLLTPLAAQVVTAPTVYSVPLLHTAGKIVQANIVSSKTSFSIDEASQIVTDFLHRPQMAKARLLDIVVFTGNGDERRYLQSRGRAPSDYHDWVRQVEQQPAFQGSMAQAVVLDGAGILRHVSADHVYTERLFGHAPSRLNRQWEVLVATINAPAPLEPTRATVHVFIRSHTSYNEESCSKIADQLVNLLETSPILIYLRSDSLFFQSGEFPLIYPFERTIVSSEAAFLRNTMFLAWAEPNNTTCTPLQ